MTTRLAIAMALAAACAMTTPTAAHAFPAAFIVPVDPMTVAATGTDMGGLHVVSRRNCRPGMRWSTYHRKCVLWLPLSPS